MRPRLCAAAIRHAQRRKLPPPHRRARTRVGLRLQLYARAPRQPAQGGAQRGDRLSKNSKIIAFVCAQYKITVQSTLENLYL